MILRRVSPVRFLLLFILFLCGFASFAPKVHAAGIISGTIRDWDIPGTVYPGVTVRLYDSAGVFITSVVTNGSGLYTFPSQADGTYHVAPDAPVNGGATSELALASVSGGGVGSGAIVQSMHLLCK